jgi:hypothetical protein
MKAAFYTLLLLNLVFFGWAHWIDSRRASAPAAPVQALPTLTLLQAGTGQIPMTQASPAPPVAPVPQPSSVGVASATVRCRSLGPFMSPATAQQMAGRLQSRGLAPTDRSVDISINDGYTVYLSEIGAPADVQRSVLAKLQRAGIQDAHAVNGPGQEPRISLGLFVDQARAVRLAEQLRQLGLKPVLDIHQSTVNTHWLDLQLEPNEPTPPLNQLLQEMPGGAAAVTPMVSFSDCPASPASG